MDLGSRPAGFLDVVLTLDNRLVSEELIACDCASQVEFLSVCVLLEYVLSLNTCGEKR